MRRAVRSPVSRATTARHQLVGVQAALHQRLGLALAHQLHRLGGGRLAVRRVDDLERRRCRCRTARRPPRCARAGPTRIGAIRPSVAASTAPSQRALVAGMRDRRRRRRQRLAGRDQPFGTSRACVPSPPRYRNTAAALTRPCMLHEPDESLHEPAQRVRDLRVHDRAGGVEDAARARHLISRPPNQGAAPSVRSTGSHPLCARMVPKPPGDAPITADRPVAEHARDVARPGATASRSRS